MLRSAVKHHTILKAKTEESTRSKLRDKKNTEGSESDHTHPRHESENTENEWSEKTENDALKDERTETGRYM